MLLAEESPLKINAAAKPLECMWLCATSHGSLVINRGTRLQRFSEPRGLTPASAWHRIDVGNEEEVMASKEQMTQIVTAEGEEPVFAPGDEIVIARRFPIGHFRVPNFIRGRNGVVESVIHPRAIDNEEEGFGRNAGCRRHYYRIAIPMTELWPEYTGSPQDGLRIEVFETWLERRASHE